MDQLAGGRFNGATRPSWRCTTIWNSSTTQPEALGPLPIAPTAFEARHEKASHDQAAAISVHQSGLLHLDGRELAEDRVLKAKGYDRSSSFCPLRGRRSDGPDRNLGLAIAICQDVR